MTGHLAEQSYLKKDSFVDDVTELQVDLIVI